MEKNNPNVFAGIIHHVLKDAGFEGLKPDSPFYIHQFAFNAIPEEEKDRLQIPENVLPYETTFIVENDGKKFTFSLFTCVELEDVSDFNDSSVDLEEGGEFDVMDEKDIA